MSLIRIATLTILFILLTALPSHPTRAIVPNVPEQFSCANVIEIPQVECEALVALYNGTDGPNWFDNTGWLVADTPCSWYGVTCNNEHVEELRLTRVSWSKDPFGLQGDLPSEIGNLGQLTVLSLYANRLSSLPAEIGNLNNLLRLSLGSNQLNNLPLEIGGLNNLTSLSLHNNQLSSLPTTMGTLNTLTTLDLSSNQLNGLPAEIGSLNNLIGLFLSSNQLSYLPIEIMNLRNLTSLDLTYNRLVISDNSLRSFITEHDVDWSATQTSPPTELKATILDKESIELTWTPITFQGKGGHYQISIIDDGNFTSYPTDSKSDSSEVIDGLTSGSVYNFRIQTYTPKHDADTNEPLDDQPNELWSAYSEEVSIIMSEDDTLTPVPTPLPQFSCASVTEIPRIECEALVAIYNESLLPKNWEYEQSWLLTDTPCSWYGVFCNEGHILQLSLSTFSGLFGGPIELPSEIGNLHYLTSLDLSNNWLFSLPAEIGNLNGLTRLDLSSNWLDHLPAEISRLNSLTQLDLSNNNLISLTSEIGNLNNLTSLNLSSNPLISLTAEIGNLNSLTHLDLSNNQLVSLTTEIANLSSLTHLDLVFNRLSSLPADISNLNNLTSLDLSYNQLVLLNNDLRVFVTAQDPDWTTTQTIAPTDIKAKVLGADSIELIWDPITFQEGGGYYEIGVADGGEFMVHGTTSKSDSRYLIDGLDSGTTYDIRTRTYTPSEDILLESMSIWFEVWSDYSAIVSAKTLDTLTAVPTATPNITYTATPTPIASPDSYESDDNCQSARPLYLDETPQSHNFHQGGNEDWLYFELQKDIRYHFVAETSDPNTQLELELYSDCESIPDETSMPSFGSAEIIFTVPTSERYYAKITNRDPNFLNEGGVYEVSLSIHDNGGDLAVIITGHDDGFTRQDNIMRAANSAYQTFLKGGIRPSRIRYLGLRGDDRGDADDDGISDIDTEATLANVEKVITQWTAAYADDEARIFIYIIDHGLMDELMVNGNEDMLTVGQLDSWLDQLESKSEAPIAIIYEASLSGSFITGVKSISKKGRIVITSTDGGNNAYPQQQRGTHFSDAFFSALRQGKDFYQAFNISSNASAQTLLSQYPMLDDNGDGKYTQDDGNSAQTWKLAYPRNRGDEEEILEQDLNLSSPKPPSPKSIIEGHGIIQVEASPLENISEIWAEVYRPDFVEPATVIDGIMPELNLDRIEFSDNDKDGIYRALYDNFIQTGTYRFIIYGTDREGNLTPPTVLAVEFDIPGDYRLYLPVIQR